MKQNRFLIKNLNTNKYRLYLKFYRLGFDKKRLWGYTNYLAPLLQIFKYSYKTLLHYYIHTHLKSFKYTVFGSKIPYLYLISRCKYLNNDFYVKLTNHTHMFKKDKFLYFPPNRVIGEINQHLVETPSPITNFYLFKGRLLIYPTNKTPQSTTLINKTPQLLLFPNYLIYYTLILRFFLK